MGALDVDLSDLYECHKHKNNKFILDFTVSKSQNPVQKSLSHLVLIDFDSKRYDAVYSDQQIKHTHHCGWLR